jgi:hypothetical protein
LAACGGDPEPTTAPSPTITSASPTPIPEPTTLLSGREGKDGRVLAVKIDNTGHSHPQAGVMAADLVYVQEVEWGLTRLVTVYSSELPKQIGPVRSARVTDLELLAQFGRIAFAYSGANPALLPDLAAASFYRVSYDVSGEGYQRSPERAAPWNVFADPDALLDRAPGSAKATDVGFTFGDQPDGGKRARGVTVSWPDSTLRFRWNPQKQRYLTWSDGEPAMAAEGPQLGGTTVIVQAVDSYPSGYGDAYGGVTPMSETVGRGPAWVLRDGRVWKVQWVRRSEERGTRWLYRGQDLPLAGGQVWILLMDNDRRPSFG